MRIEPVLTTITLLGALLAPSAALAAEGAGSLVYIATRATPQAAAGPQGIYAARLDATTGRLEALGLQVELTRASWLQAHPTEPLLFMSANLDGNTAVESKLYSYSVDKASGKLRQIGVTDSGGRDTTHLVFDARSNTLIGASFASGEVTSSPVQSDGSVGPVASAQQNYGTGPHPRQSAPHAHAVAIDPARRFVVSADMGADRLFVYRFDRATRTLSPAQTPFEQTPPGSGPRHLVFHPNGKFFYTNTELSAEVRAYRWDARQGRITLIEAVPAYPAGYTGTQKSSAEIAIAADGRQLYVSLRGDQNSLVVYDVDRRSGRIQETQRVASSGTTPRSFGIDPSGRWLLVANEMSNTINVFGIDAASGKLTPTGTSVPVPNAAALAFFSH